jgi:hypothetical protein
MFRLTGDAAKDFEAFRSDPTVITLVDTVATPDVGMPPQVSGTSGW